MKYWVSIIAFVLTLDLSGQIPGKTFTIYWPNGNIKSIEKGKGKSRVSASYYDEEGRIILEQTFHKGFPDYGKSYEYISNDVYMTEVIGDFISECQFLNGKKHGRWVYINDDGNLEKEILYVNDENISETTYEYWNAATLKSEKHFVKNKKSGIWVSWFSDGSLEKQQHYQKDVLNGWSVSFQVSGKSHHEFYQNGILINKFRIDSEKTYHFIEDKKEYELNFHSSGIRKSLGKIYNGQKTGLWFFYQESGKIDHFEYYKGALEYPEDLQMQLELVKRPSTIYLYSTNNELKAKALLDRASYLGLSGNDPAKGINDCSKAVTLSWSSKKMLGQSLFLRALIKWKSKDQNGGIYDWILAEENQHNYFEKDVHSFYDSLIHAYPDKGGLYVVRAIVLNKENKKEEALDYIDKAQRLGFYDKKTFYHKASFTRELQRYRSALGLINKSIEMDTLYEDAYRLRAWIRNDLLDLKTARIDSRNADNINYERPLEKIYKNTSLLSDIRVIDPIEQIIPETKVKAAETFQETILFRDFIDQDNTLNGKLWMFYSDYERDSIHRPFTKNTCFFYSVDGELKSIGEGTLNNGHKEGSWKEWLVNRRSNYYNYVEAEYKNNLLDGRKKVFGHVKGVLLTEEIYHNGTLSKIITRKSYWDSDYTQLKDLLEKNTSYTSWHKNGQIQSTGHYKRNTMEGVWHYYDENGNFLYKRTYKNGVDIDKKKTEPYRKF